jgi:hypothetical protein
MTGPVRVLAATYSILALAAGARSLTQIATRLSEAALAYGLSAVAAATYLVIAIALRQPSRRRRQILVVACSGELAGVLAVGTATLMRPRAFADQTVWSHYGEGYACLPLVLPVLTLAWLARDAVACRRAADPLRSPSYFGQSPANRGEPPKARR